MRPSRINSPNKRSTILELPALPEDSERRQEVPEPEGGGDGMSSGYREGPIHKALFLHRRRCGRPTLVKILAVRWGVREGGPPSWSVSISNAGGGAQVAGVTERNAAR